MLFLKASGFVKYPSKSKLRCCQMDLQVDIIESYLIVIVNIVNYWAASDQTKEFSCLILQENQSSASTVL